jgi:hypothetical protein
MRAPVRIHLVSALDQRRHLPVGPNRLAGKHLPPVSIAWQARIGLACSSHHSESSCRSASSRPSAFIPFKRFVAVCSRVQLDSALQYGKRSVSFNRSDWFERPYRLYGLSARLSSISVCRCSSVIPWPSVLSSAAAAFSFHRSFFVGQSFWDDLVAPVLIRHRFLFDRLLRRAAFAPHRCFLAGQSFRFSLVAALLIRHWFPFGLILRRAAFSPHRSFFAGQSFRHNRTFGRLE